MPQRWLGPHSKKQSPWITAQGSYMMAIDAPSSTVTFRQSWHLAFWILGSLLLSPLPALSQQPAAKTPKDAILILDASGSMWGQIDGVNKIVIAKDVVEGLVRGLPAEQRLGLVAYGHRRESDCADIETLADIGAARADVITKLR
ncbi:MAG: VWA domain-containing protein, partial [Halioglobus sp.]|nr:VWA domain-containing protein [Halioglobus sp.]